MTSANKNLNNQIIKRALSKASKGKNIYITNTNNIKTFLKKCEKFLEAGEFEIFIHALGAAITPACNLALQLQENHFGTLGIDTKTSTIATTDDTVTFADTKSSPNFINRQNSAIQIRIYRKLQIGELKFASVQH